MYGLQSILDPCFVALYGGVTLLTLVAALYLLLRRSNIIAPEVSSSRVLRRWTAAFFLASALSHVLWFVLGEHWLTDDRLVRNILVIMLDEVTLVPLVMAVLLAMLQDRHRPVWPWWLAQLPVLVLCGMGMVQRNWCVGYTLAHYWQLAVIVTFVAYYVFALRHYGRWLLDNFADLEHKEVWQSLVFAIALFGAYELYTSNGGDLMREYLSQVLTIVIVGFLLWRVETLEELRDEWGG
ncbi:MAG: hypothetical protein IJ551_07780 [Prevotella sp.]|nr:hypothetical protein [Prevotella sp.]